MNGCSKTPQAWNGVVAWASNASYNAAGQLTGAEFLHDVSLSCAGTAVNFYNEAWQYNALNQVTEIDTSAQFNGYPYGGPYPGWRVTFLSGITSARRRITGRSGRRTMRDWATAWAISTTY